MINFNAKDKKLICNACKMSYICYDNVITIKKDLSLIFCDTIIECNLSPFAAPHCNDFCTKHKNKQNFLFINDNKYDAQCYLYKYKNTIYITFRGTDSAIDVMIDFNVNLSKFPNDNINCQIHSGFCLQFESVKLIINNFINSHKFTNIIVTGHSLGAALATISALYYKLLYPNKNVKCITFGSPRVGDCDFAKLFDKHIDKSFRIINKNDLVPYFPDALRFRHVNTEMFISKTSTCMIAKNLEKSINKNCVNFVTKNVEIIFSTINKIIGSMFGHCASPIDNHQIKNYLNCIKKIFN